MGEEPVPVQSYLSQLPHRLPWVGSQVPSSAEGMASQFALVEPFCQNEIFKASMGVITKEAKVKLKGP
jgi:hypothetical protein